MADDRGEVERIRKAYGDRQERVGDKYSHFNPATLLQVQQRERILLGALAQHGIHDLTSVQILDVGCGLGDALRRFISYGVRPERLHGIDLLPERASLARCLAPQVNFVCGNAAALPYPDARFSIVMQLTAFSSVLDPGLRARMAAEMLRVLHPSGLIIWYDFWLNPTNRGVKGIGPGEVRRLFPGCRYQFRRLTLAPPLARLFVGRSVLLCQMLERVPFLLSHYLAVIRPP